MLRAISLASHLRLTLRVIPTSCLFLSFQSLYLLIECIGIIELDISLEVIEFGIELLVEAQSLRAVSGGDFFLIKSLAY